MTYFTPVSSAASRVNANTSSRVRCSKPELPGAAHELPHALGQAHVVVIHADTAGRELLHPGAKMALQLVEPHEDVVELVTVRRVDLVQVSALDAIGDVLGNMRGADRRPGHADRLNIGCAQGESFEDLVLEGDPARDHQVGHVLAARRQPVHVLTGQGQHFDGRNAPLVHHAPWAHAGAATRGIHGENVNLGHRRILDRAGKVRRPVSAGLQEHVLGAHVPQFLDTLHEPLFGHHADARMPLELLDRAPLVGFLDVRVVRVREDDVPATLKALRLGQLVDLHLAADVLGALAPLQLGDRDAEFLNPVLHDAQAAVLDVLLQHDAAKTILLPVPEGAHAVAHVRRLQHLRNWVPGELGFVVHPADVLADGQKRTGQCRAGCQAASVLAGDVGAAQAGDNERQVQLDAAIVAKGDGEVKGREDRLVTVGLNTDSAHGGAADVEVRMVDRVLLFSPGGHVAEGLGVDGLRATVCGPADLAVPRAAVEAGGAHPAQARV